MPVDPRRLQDVFLSAVQAGGPEGRAAVIDRECSADTELRDHVNALLEMHDLPDNVLDTPALSDAATGMGLHDETPVPGAARVAKRQLCRVGPGSVIAGRYELKELLGEGGMGSVYRAEQTTPVRRIVAIKLIKAGMNTAAVLARFELELQALALMDHPNIAKVLDAGEVNAETGSCDKTELLLRGGSRPYFVMELIEGEPITKFCARQGLSLVERLQLFIPICRAVQHAHQKGIIHRDLKPGNLLVSNRDGKPVPIVIDFGIAKSTGASLDTLVVESGPGLFMGSLDYMAPEQATYEPANVDTRTDVYALGAILYELVCGVVPYGADRLRRAPVFEVSRILREEEPPSPSARADRDAAAAAAAGMPDSARLGGRLRGELDWIVMTCLEKEADRRYPSAGALADDLARFLNNEPVAAGRPSATYRIRKFVRRNRTATLAAAAVTIALIGGTAGTTWGLVQARKAEAAALEERDQKIVALAAEATQRKEAEAQRARANDETAVALSVLKFVQDDLLRQADPNWQVLANSEVDSNLTVRAALDRSSATVERRFKNKPLAEAAIRRTIGCAYEGLGESGKAAVHLAKSQALYEKLAGPDDERTIGVMMNLAIAYGKTIRVKEAVALLEKVCEWRRARLGPDHQETMAAESSLAVALVKTGRHDDGEKILNDLLLRGQKDKANPINALAALNNLAYLDAERGRLDVAVARMEELNRQWNDVFGPDAPQKMEFLNNLGQMYLRVGRVAEGIPLLEESRDRVAKMYPPDHPRLAVASSALGDAYWQAGRTADAAKVLEQSRNRQRARLGPTNQRVLLSTIEMAVLAAETGDLAHAEEWSRAVVNALPSTGVGSITKALAQSALARILYLAGKFDEAEPLAREALTTFSSRRPNDWPANDAKMILGMIQAKRGQADEARTLVSEGFGVLKKLDPRLPYAVRVRLPEAEAALAQMTPAQDKAE